MKKVLFSAMALTMSLMMLVSCNKDKKDPKEAVFTANIEQHIGQQNRTVINPENGDVKWLAGDKILVANGNGETAAFTLQSGAGTTEGTFRTTGEFEMTEPFVAVYPQTATLNGTTATFNLPAIQTLTQTGTFANGANPMAAYAEDENLFFMNLCGGLDVRLLGDNIHVSGIRITGSESENLNGTFTVDCSANEPTLMASQGSNGTNIVTLNCDVTLTSTTTPQEFFIVLPVGALAQGFTMEVLDGEEVICTKQLETNLAQIVRNEVKRFNPLLIVTETPTPIELPDVTTAQVTNITTTSATAGGEILSNGGSAITECGVCWCTEGEPTIDGDHIATQVTMGEFSVTVAGLTQNTTYNIRAYATNEAGTGYGEVLTFTTEEEIIITAPTVTTNEVTEITTTTAIVGGQITSTGNSIISESGICYKTGNEDWTCVALEATNNAFSTTITGLTANTSYTVRAYATNEEGTGYGEEVSFTTLNEGGGDEHEYVDLGLPSGLLWATCNVGADTPEGYGDYFAWGETTPKSVYNWSNYIYGNLDDGLTKYCYNSIYGYNGFSDNLTTLLPEDDAATANWGNDWRMPTQEEWQELYSNTTCIWTTHNGVNGRLFTSTNGNTLFLPEAGSYALLGNGEFLFEGGGFYWSSSLLVGGLWNDPSYGNYLYFDGSYYGMENVERCVGNSVRAVREN